ncbi:MAG: ADP-ribosylglycohydrolase family protein [Rhodothermaceae bacterium]|nr:ADP-ribosylglycohydrolase family protein [Rhodothermaceae bacterium]
METHHCPICNTALGPVPRYPRYVCRECAARAADQKGRKLTFSNVDMSGGYRAEYADTGAAYDSHVCYIDGIECRAGEARFGGIVIEAIDFPGIVKSVLFGVAVGDALGVPVEFRSREEIRRDPVTDLRGYGTYNLPPGTFSDDSSLTFCLAEALTGGYDLHAIARNFVKWKEENYWTARGVMFDIGIATSQAISRLAAGVRPDTAGGTDETSNGNGSLMRIVPLLFYIRGMPAERRFEITREVSSLTHGHIRSVIACFYYLEFARLLFDGAGLFEAYRTLQETIPEFLESVPVDPAETALFGRLLQGNIHELPEDAIQSTGYVLHTLEASVWCLLTTGSYRDAVLKAVNLGSDTDTTGAVTGGLAGLYYGLEHIPAEWMQQLARHDDIENLAERL